MGAMQHNQSTCPNNLSIFVLRITCNLFPWPGDLIMYDIQQFLNLVLNVTFVMEP